MKTIVFGTQKRAVSQIMLGLMRIRDMGTEELERFLDGAMALGVNGLDIADCYANGVCETLLGEVFARRPDLRKAAFLQSKCGIRRAEGFSYFDFSKEHILEAVDASLARLHTDHLDSLLLHRPDALMEPEEIAEAFEILHKAGKVLDFGVSNQNPMMIELLKKWVRRPLAVNQVQLSCAFTPMLDAGFNVNNQNDRATMRDGGILEYARMHGMAIQAWSVMQYGYFGGVFLGSDKYPQLNAVLERIAAEQGVPPMAVALAWILRIPGDMQAVVGTTKLSRVEEAVRACDVTLTKKDWYEIYISAGNRLP